MWKDLPDEWKMAYEEMWTAFKQGSVPIGAVLYDKSGNLIIREHNRMKESGIVNRRISHAELNALLRLDTSKYDYRDVKLYTTMEPCPMCMGTAVMTGIRHLDYAARDPYCGSVHWCMDDPYVKTKELTYTLIGGELETVQIVIQSYFELKNLDEGKSDKVLQRFDEMNSMAVNVAKKYYQERVLDTYAEKEADISTVFDMILSAVG